MLWKKNKALIKFNQTLAINRKTRSLIDDLRGERACFDNLSRKYEKAINEQQRRMTEVIEASTAAYEMRYIKNIEWFFIYTYYFILLYFIFILFYFFF